MHKKTPVPIGARLEFFSRPGDGGCVLWCGARLKRGYGRVKIDGRNVMAHRAAWEHVRGAIPTELQVLHRCDNPSCINVDHLFLGTHADNMKDMTAKGRRFQPDNRGRKHGHAKANDDKVRAIRNDARSLAEMSQEYGLSRSALCNIRSGKTWSHVQ